MSRKIIAIANQNDELERNNSGSEAQNGIQLPSGDMGKYEEEYLALIESGIAKSFLSSEQLLQLLKQDKKSLL